ncbi:hypothetical protein [Endozoicomonas sp. ALB032]|uniref:hypothetical protein n=1 Tax=Endozoicomonas sp. ALB032 TaxID=3403082 RepID=UPI003BB747BF
MYKELKIKNEVTFIRKNDQITLADEFSQEIVVFFEDKEFLESVWTLCLEVCDLENMPSKTVGQQELIDELWDTLDDVFGEFGFDE